MGGGGGARLPAPEGACFRVGRCGIDIVLNFIVCYY